MQPVLETRRLRLRPFVPGDAPDLQRLAGDRDIAAMTLTIPHPYEDGVAEDWIRASNEKFEAGQLANFAVVQATDGELVGCAGLILAPAHCTAELGYWIGKPFWNRGYCTEAAHAVLAYGFGDLGLVRIHAAHMAHNPASGRVLEKLGMVREGRLRRHLLKWGEHCDLIVFGMLAEEFVPEP